MRTDVQRRAILESYRMAAFQRAALQAADYLARQPDDGEIFAILAGASMHLGHLAEADRIAAHVADRWPAPSNLTTHALTRSALGDLQSADDLLRAAVKADPFNLRAWQAVGEVHQFGADDALERKARRIEADPRASDTLRRALNYVLCKAANDQGRWTAAWRQAERAARIATPAYDPQELRDWLVGQKACATPALVRDKSRFGSDSGAPVFIVGMPRSGTSLVEAMLGRLPEVTVLGEMPGLAQLSRQRAAAQPDGPHPSHNWLTHVSPQDVTQDAATYLTAATERAGGRIGRYFTDKVTVNLLCLPQIGILFPQARILRLHRNPLDTCVSCYLGEFAGGMNFTYRTDWLAEAYALYQQAGDHGAACIANPLLDVCYETLVTDPETTSRRIAAFLDLDWRPEMLRPQDGDAPCVTRSRAQVRQDIGTRSVDRWRRYGRAVEPLRAELARHGIAVDRLTDAA